MRLLVALGITLFFFRNTVDRSFVKQRLYPHFVKGLQYNECSVQLILKKAMKKAKIISKGSVYTLRHSYATHLIRSGVDIRVAQELLDHSDIRITMNYTHITRCR